MADQTSLFIQQRSDEMRRISEAEKNNKRVRFDAWKRIYTKKYGNKVSFGGNEAILTKADGTQVVVGNYKTDKKKTLQENKPKQKPNEEQLLIDKRIAEIDAADKKRLDDARKAENQEIRDEVALDKELNPWGIDNIRRTTGMEVGRSDAQFTKKGGYNLTIPKNVTSDKQDQSGESKWSSPSLTKDSKLTNSTDSTSGNNSNFKTDVFTINPETGKAVGVLTRSQRRAFEKKYGDKIDKLKIRSYTNKGDSYQRYG